MSLMDFHILMWTVTHYMDSKQEDPMDTHSEDLCNIRMFQNLQRKQLQRVLCDFLTNNSLLWKIFS